MPSDCHTLMSIPMPVLDIPRLAGVVEPQFDVVARGGESSQHADVYNVVDGDSLQQAGHDHDAEARRRALQGELARANMSPADAARAADMAPNRLYNFLNGHSKSLSASTLAALAKVIPGATMASLSGERDPGRGERSDSVLMRTAADLGRWRDRFELPLHEQREIPMALPPGARAAGAYGARVDAGAEGLYPPDTVLVAVPPDRYEGELRDGLRLIVERTRGDDVEVSVRELGTSDGARWLWARTSVPSLARDAVPVRLPTGKTKWKDGVDRWSIAGVVILAVIPQG